MVVAKWHFERDLSDFRERMEAATARARAEWEERRKWTETPHPYSHNMGKGT